MATPSDIILFRPETQDYVSIYCHSDGYPSHHKKILVENYSTYEQVEQLISLGDLSVLDITPDLCLSYHRWRNEPLYILVSPEIRDHCGETYCYLFKEGVWFLLGGGNKFYPLT